MNSFDYSSIFSKFKTAEGLDFNLLSKSINLPEEKDNDIYDKIYIDRDIAWTMLSYQIYGSIDFWWLLCLANKDDIFYAKSESEIYFVKQEYIDSIISAILEQLND